MATDNPPTPIETDDLRIIAGMIIPVSAEFAVPGADDPAIQADIVATLGRDAALVREALDPARQEAAAIALRVTGGAAVATLTRVVLQCYYRDDRVVRSLGSEPRRPYPKGHILEDGDWSLLDPVRRRPPMWRRV